ncbi:MAG: hypothetical protein K0R24_123 [Gammaproteobacteria bacterium]|jgi:hypothetical protein|nr:hypothetical protein [Gammaproteobacteria bacterium]
MQRKEIIKEAEKFHIFNSIKCETKELIGILYYSYCMEELKNIRQLPDLLEKMINISEILKPWTIEDSQYRSEAIILQIGLLLSRSTLLMLSRDSRAVVLTELLYKDAKRYSSFVERENPNIVETLRLYPFDMEDKSIHTDLPNWLYVYYNEYRGNDNKQAIIKKGLNLNVARCAANVDIARCHEELAKFYKNSGRKKEAYEQLIAARNTYIQLKQQADVNRITEALQELLFPQARQSFFPPAQNANRMPDNQRNNIKGSCCRIL